MSFFLTEKVRRVLSLENISTEEVGHMVTHAAPVTNERGNRRFHQWLFSIQNGEVKNMQHWEPPTRRIKARADMVSFDECDACDGEGCKACGWTGEIRTEYHK